MTETGCENQCNVVVERQIDPTAHRLWSLRLSGSTESRSGSRFSDLWGRRSARSFSGRLNLDCLGADLWKSELDFGSSGPKAVWR